ncbi:MAG: UDP-N-acetylmuramoyl-L-alanyl-D-glutamate--2,6-diaminopimelate ligase [Clostridia bacterium]
MKLREIIDNIDCSMEYSNEILDYDIENLSIDANNCKNSVFFLLRENEDKVKLCIENGAKVIVSVVPIPTIACIVVTEIRKVMSSMSANFYNNSHKKLKIIGVVGTNGKTTTTCVLGQILRKANKKCAILGTLGVDYGDEKIETNLTTPDPIELHKIFFEAVKRNEEYVIMEVSAHAIFWQKMYGIQLYALIFTNISQDHLDFFGNMQNYSDTKLNYINSNNTKLAIINADSEHANKFRNDKSINKVFYGLNNPSDVFAVDICYKNGKSCYVINAFDDIFEINVPLLGEYNVYNVLGAVSCAFMMGIDKDSIIEALDNLEEIDGRYNILRSDILVIIDYAHTPDGLKVLLESVKAFAEGDIISVFGCGGDRDKAKRPIMGEIAAKLSDYCVITSDNPRTENPVDIVESIEDGYKKISDNYILIVDRKKAIQYAIKKANKGDVVVIAGKGTEPYIDIGGKKIPYSDKKVTIDALRRYRIE